MAHWRQLDRDGELSGDKLKDLFKPYKGFRWPDQKKRNNTFPERAKTSIQKLNMCYEEHFAVYVCLYCFRHCQVVARLPEDATDISSMLIQALLETRSAFRPWVFYITMVASEAAYHYFEGANRKKRLRIRYLGYELKDQVRDVLEFDGKSGHLQPAPQFVLTRWDLFGLLISSSQDLESALRSIIQPPELRISGKSKCSLSTMLWRIDISLVDDIFRNPYSMNIFDQTTLHMAALNGFPGAILPLLLGQRTRTAHSTAQFLRRRGNYGMDAMCLAAFGPYRGYLSSPFPLEEPGSDYPSTIRKLLAAEAILVQSSSLSSVPIEPNKSQPLLHRFDSDENLPLDIALHEVTEFVDWSPQPAHIFYSYLEMICVMLYHFRQQLNPQQYWHILKLWAESDDDDQAQKLWIAASLQDRKQTLIEMSHLRFPYLVWMVMDHSKWETRMSTIVDTKPEILLQLDDDGSSMMEFLLKRDPMKIQWLAAAQLDHFGPQLASDNVLLYLKNRCGGYKGDSSVLRSLLSLGPDLRKPIFDQMTILHHFGQNTRTHDHYTEKPSFLPNRLFDCSLLDSAGDLFDLLDGHARLFEHVSGGRPALSTILEKIRSHIGYKAFILLSQCVTANNESFVHRRREVQRSTLLDLLVKIVEAYRQKVSSETATATDVSIDIEGLSPRQYTAEEIVTLDEARKYEDELSDLTKSLEELARIETEKWNGEEYQRGYWEDELEWACPRFLSESEIAYLVSLQAPEPGWVRRLRGHHYAF